MPGPIPDEEIKRVAVRICEELGLNPDENVTVKHGNTITRWETRSRAYSPMRPITHQLPPYLDKYDQKITPPPFVVANDDIWQMNEVVNAQRWQTFRRDAEAAIAGWRAVHQYVLLET